jgi:hypothetical protein
MEPLEAITHQKQVFFDPQVQWYALLVALSDKCLLVMLLNLRSMTGTGSTRYYLGPAFPRCKDSQPQIR